MKLGLSGQMTRAGIRSPLTPLFLLAALALGIVALLVIPREEEPQISVPMVDIRIVADGLKADDAVELVTKPLEAIVKGIDGVEHVYSQTEDDRVLVTAWFVVGTRADDAILRIHEKVRANLDRIPIGIPEPLIVGRGIEDVAVVVLTLSPAPDVADRWTDTDLYRVADELRAELVKVADVGLSYVTGGGPPQTRVEPDPERLALFGVTLQQLVAKVRDANRSFLAGEVREGGAMQTVVAGGTLSGPSDRPAAGHHSRRPPGLRARRRGGGGWWRPRGTSRLDGRPGARRDVEPIAGGDRGIREAVWRQCRRCQRTSAAAPRELEGPAGPRRCQRDRHAGLWRDRE